MAITDNQRKAAEKTLKPILGLKELKNLGNASIKKFIDGDAAGKSGKSIIGMAAKNTFEFPVFVSKSVPLDYATATCTLLEQVYASYLQMAISMNPIVDSRSLTKMGGGGGYLASFKTNTTKYLEYTDMSYAHDACHNVINEDDQIAEFDMISIDEEVGKLITEACEYEPLSEFNHFFVESKNTDKMMSHDDFIADWIANHKDENTGRASGADAEAAWANYKKTYAQAVDQQWKNTDTGDIREGERAKAKKAKMDIEDLETPEGTTTTYKGEIIHRRRKLASEEKLASKNAARADERWQMEKNKDAREKMTRSPEIMDETKIRKLNSLKPLMMKVQIRVSNKSGDISDYPVELICGVKVHCRLIDSEILPEVAKYPIKEMNEVTRDVKYKAGELKFKELIFDIKGKKQAAIDSKDPSRKWYRRLYQLAHMKGDSFVAQNISGNGTKGLIPNAAMIITNDDVENVKSETNIDLLNGSTGCKICKELFMMALIVIDTDQESVKMLTPDINSDYEVHSLAAINKQLAELDTAGKKTRDIFKLLG